MCMMGWWMVFVGENIYQNLLVVVGSMGYALDFVIVCMTYISFGFGRLWMVAMGFGNIVVLGNGLIIFY